MSGSSLTGMSDFSLLDLFREEVRTHGGAFVEGLAVLSSDVTNVANIEPLMRAAHSIKGAARIVKVEPVVLVSDAMQEVLLAAMNETLMLSPDALRILERGMSTLTQIAALPEDQFEQWLPARNADMRNLLADLKTISHPSEPIPRESRTEALTADFVPQAAATSPRRTVPATLVDVFREEVRGQAQALSEGLVALEREPLNMPLIETLMRAAHTIKAAARIVNFDAAVQVAHALEDNLFAAQQGRLKLSPHEIDCLLRTVDLLTRFASISEMEFANWLPSDNKEVGALIGELSELAARSFVPAPPITAAIAEPQPSPSQLAEPSLLELFREEVTSQTQALNDGLVALEAEPQNLQLVDSLMRAAHSIKGAARIVSLEAAERVAHVLEDVLVAAQQRTITLTSAEIDLLLRGVDLLSEIGSSTDADSNKWLPAKNSNVRTLIEQLTAVAHGAAASTPIRDTGERSRIRRVVRRKRCVFSRRRGSSPVQAAHDGARIPRRDCSTSAAATDRGSVGG